MFIHCGKPWHSCSHLPYPLSRQGTAAAAHPHACFRKGCSRVASCTPASVGQQGTHSSIHTRTHNANAHTHAHTHTHTCTRTNTQTHTYARTHAHACARAHAHTHTHIHIRTYACVASIMSFVKFSAPLASLPHLTRDTPATPFHCFSFYFRFLVCVRNVEYGRTSKKN